MTKPVPADNLKLAIGAIVTACLALSLGDALIKQQSVEFVLWQIFILRSVIVLPFLVYLVCRRQPRFSFMPKYPGWTLVRSLILVSMWVAYFIALPQVEFAVAAAAYYTLPIFISLLAALFLGERITARGWFAVALGFGGVLLVLQPSSGDFNAWVLLPLVSALLYAVAMIMTRSKCRSEKATLLSLWLNFSFVGVGALALLLLWLFSPEPQVVASNPFLFGPWTPMGASEWRTMGILAVAIFAGSILAAVAYQNGPASTVSIFDFSYVGFAAVWGYLMFAEVPTPLVSLGILLIVASGMLASQPAPGR